MPLSLFRIPIAVFFPALFLACAPVPAAGAPAVQSLRSSPSSLSSVDAAPALPRPEPLGAGADTAGGYAGHVLETLLPFWEPPEGASGVVQVALRLSSEGRLLFCETKRESGNAGLDASPCLAALKPKTFGVPPYGMVTEVYLTLATDRAALLAGAENADSGPKTDAPANAYAGQVMRAVRPHVEVPPRLGGRYTVEVDVHIVDTRGRGGVEQITVSTSSGRGEVDAAVLSALCAPGILPPPPTGKAELRLTFTVESN